LKKLLFNFGERVLSSEDDPILNNKDFRFLGAKAKNLINALESMDESNIPEKGDCGIVEDAIESKKEAKCKNCHKEFKQFHRSDYFCSNYCISTHHLKEDCPNEQAAEEWNTTEIREEKESEEEKQNFCGISVVSGEPFWCKDHEHLDPNFKKLEEKPKSIWKDVRELPKESCSLILKDERGIYQSGNYLSGLFMTDGKKFNAVKYTTTTDFINAFENLQERVRKLEGK
jgi:hypothetical protein